MGLMGQDKALLGRGVRPQLTSEWTWEATLNAVYLVGQPYLGHGAERRLAHPDRLAQVLQDLPADGINRALDLLLPLPSADTVAVMQDIAAGELHVADELAHYKEHIGFLMSAASAAAVAAAAAAAAAHLISGSKHSAALESCAHDSSRPRPMV